MSLPVLAARSPTCCLGIVLAFRPSLSTHCARISTLIGLTRQTLPLAVEKDLAEVLPPED